MKTKTYIKWPFKEKTTDSHGFKIDKDSLHVEEERKMFWKRLMKAVMPYDIEESRS